MPRFRLFTPPVHTYFRDPPPRLYQSNEPLFPKYEPKRAKIRPHRPSKPPKHPISVKVAEFLYNTPMVTPRALPEIKIFQQIHSGISLIHLCPGSKHPNSMIPLRLPVEVAILPKPTQIPIHAQFTPPVASPSRSEHPYPS